MAQISTANLQTLLDKMARWAAEANGDALASAVATGGAYAATVPNSGLVVANSDVLATLDTLVLTTIADPDLDRLVYPFVDQLKIQNPVGNSTWAAIWGQVLNALDAYGAYWNALTLADKGGLDAMLRVLNAAAPTLRVHAAFAKYFGRVSPGNVFTDVPYVLGTIAVTGASAGTYTPTGLNGTGNLDTTRFGPGKIALQNTKGSAEGTLDVVTVNAIKNGVSTPETFTAGATSNNYLTQATGDVTLTFSGVAAQVPTISSGTNADAFSLVILPDRAINAV